MAFLYQNVRKIVSSDSIHKRSLFYWINLQFNTIDQARRAKIGPDRSCAEWILRNGGSVKFENASEPLKDYNALPKEEIPLRLEEINANDCSIMHNGFGHLEGCGQIKKITFHKCNYLENEALQGLAYVKNSLNHLKISSCGNISEEGISHVNVLTKLKKLELLDLPLKNKEKTLSNLKEKLPECQINVQ